MLALSDKLVIDLEAIKAALKKSKLIQEEVTENDIKSGKYERLMYADVQINDKCKRIHNYVSAKIMYRNLMFSIVLSVLVSVLVRAHNLIRSAPFSHTNNKAHGIVEGKLTKMLTRKVTTRIIGEQPMVIGHIFDNRVQFFFYF